MSQFLTWLPEWTGDVVLLLLLLVTFGIVAGWLWLLIWEEIA